jgi:hypothetical protein
MVRRVRRVCMAVTSRRITISLLAGVRPAPGPGVAGTGRACDGGVRESAETGRL